MTAAGAGLVTPEAVVLDLPVANVGSRAVALLIDAVASFGTVLLLSLVASFADLQLGGTFADVLVFVAVFAALFLYPCLFETFARGRTPGKMVMGLRVMTVEGGPVAFRHAAIRAALAPIELWASSGGLALVSSLATQRSQRLGDLAAGTVVVQDRVPGGALSSTTFDAPSGAEDFVRQLDVAGLREDDYLLVRALLVRDTNLPGDRGRELARDLADRLRARLAPAPPAGMDPRTYLTCVAAAHQRRHAGRRDRDVADWVWRQD